MKISITEKRNAFKYRCIGDNCQDQKNHQIPVSFMGTCLTCPTNLVPTYTWTLYTAADNQEVEMSGYFTSVVIDGGKSSVFKLEADVLAPGVSYIMMLTVHVPGLEDGFNQNTFDVNVPPTGGSVAITPQIGTN